MSGEEGGGETPKVIPDEPAALQELEERLLDRLLHKVHEGQLGEPKIHRYSKHG